MKDSKTITVRNDFVNGRRRIIVHNSSDGTYGRDTVIPFPQETKDESHIQKFSVKPGGHLLITIAPGPGFLTKESNIDLHLNPADEFSFTLYSSITDGIRVSPFEEDTIRIPEGPPTWQLLFKRPSKPCKKGEVEAVSMNPKVGDDTNVTVGDNGPGGN